MYEFRYILRSVNKVIIWISMLANKRIQIRTNIRKSEIQQHFALRRMEIVQGKHVLVQELY